MATEMKIEITQQIIEKLAYVRFLYDQGISNSNKVYPFSTVAILNYHDAVEFFLSVIMDGYGVKKSDKIGECISLLKSKNVPITGDIGIQKIVKIRNNLKHAALIPSTIQLSEATMNIVTFFNENILNLLKLEFDQISTAQLVADEEVKNHLINANNKLKIKDIMGILYELACAFWKVVDKYKEKANKIYPLPFQFGRRNSLNNSLFMKLDEGTKHYFDHADINNEFSNIQAKFKEIGRFVDSSKETIESMQDAVEMLSLGINYKEFVIFSQMVPRASRDLAGEYHVAVGGRMATNEFTKDDLQYCTEFIVGCYFLLNS